MAHFYRLILAALLAVFSFSAHALIPTVKLWSFNGPENSNAVYSSASEACAAYLVKRRANTPSSWVWSAKSLVMNSDIKGTCTVTVVTSAGAAAQDDVATVNAQGGACPANSTPSGGQCQCVSGYAELSGTSCVIDNGCLSTMGMTPPNDAACVNGECQYGYKFSSGQPAVANPYGRFCNKGCTVKGDLSACGQYSSGVMISGQGVCIIKNSFYTGDKCTGSGEVSGPSSQGTQGGTTTDPSGVKVEANPVPERLPPGKCPGTFQGVSVVVSCDSTSSNSTSTQNGTVKNPDGSVTNNTTNNTTIKNTICNGGSCTTTTTVTSGGSGPNGTGAGSTTTTTTETGPKAEVCAKNPGIGACQGDDKKATGFGGSCAGGFKAVSEDAVLNAMAEEQYRRNCQLLATDGGEASEVATEMAKTGNRTGDSGNNSTVNVGPGSFDTSNALGGGACNIDKTVNVWRGYSVTLPFSNACNFLLWMGNLGVACALLLAARIVARG